MKGDFNRCLAKVLVHEGGYVDHPADPGGATNMGITRRTLEDWRGEHVSKKDVADLTYAEAAEIYRAKYWNNIAGDALPCGVDYAIFDYAVNSGVRRAAKALQRVVGAAPDGIIGPMTLRNVDDCVASTTNRLKVIDAVCDRRLSFLQRLGTWRTFRRGWSRRVAEVREDAKFMARRLR